MKLKRSTIVISLLVVLGLAGCSQSPEAKEAKYLEKGKKEFQKKNYPVAVLHFKNAMTAKPTDAEPYYQLGISYLAMNDVRTGGGYLKRATELNPKHTSAQLKFAELLAGGDKENVEDAQQRAQTVLALLPDNVEALDVLAVTELRLGKPDSAEEHLQQALRKSPGHLQTSITLAQVRLARKDIAGAEQVLKEAADLSPKSPDPRVYLGGFYMAQGKLAEAEQEYRRALAIDPKNGSALLSLAALQIKQGQMDQAEQTYRQISALPDKQYRPMHALFLFRNGKRDEAIKELEKLNAADTSDRNVRTELVSAYLSVNRPSDAEKVLTAALKKNRLDTDALMQRASIYLDSGKYTEAQTDLNQVLHYQSGSAQAHYLLSRISRAKGDSALQQQELGQVLQLKPDYLAARVDMAELLLKNNAAQSALQLLDEAPENQKQNLAVIVPRNWALIALGRFTDARRDVDRILAAAPIPDALLQDASLKLAQKDYAGARAEVEKVLGKNPGDVRALSALLQIYAAQKQVPAGLQKLREYAAKEPSAAPVQELLGQVLLQSGDRAGARQALNAAVAASPALLTADLLLSQLDVMEGKRDDARKRLAGIVSAHPANVLARQMTALIDIGDGKNAAAIEQYRKVLELDPKNVDAMNNLAYLLADGKQADEALKYAQMAKQLSPENAAVDDTLGWTYYQKGLYQLAVTHLESAGARQDNARRRYHLAMAYLKAGDPVRGRQALNQALKMDPNIPESRVAQQAFGSAGK